MAANVQPLFRPLGIGELLDQAFRLYRRNFLKFIGNLRHRSGAFDLDLVAVI